ncbi:type IV pilin [Methanoregula sp.]|uniref:type IV pilin n=1 Tax=Methanoregula sp. TaxID=2052170 RepID=UPI00236DFDB1|nr:type IV pilin [Methanoregula sp.]MDD1686442.1 type IV pilin [Methanoregula sp.]
MSELGEYMMKNQRDMAVSPVVGVMLMLVVVIIIAAVVSGFAGGLVGGSNQKTPSLTMDVKIVNSGSWTASGFSATVTGVSEPILTSDLKIITSWKTRMKNNLGTANTDLSLINNGTVISGGNTTLGGRANVIVVEPDHSLTESVMSIAPYGFGMPQAAGQAAIPQSQETPYKNLDQQFGNYSLSPGVSMSAKPYGSKQDGTGDPYTNGYGLKYPFAYTTDSDVYTDPIQAVLGYGWEELRAGDIVTVKFVHIPSGKTLYSKDVAVTEG